MNSAQYSSVYFRDGYPFWTMCDMSKPSLRAVLASLMERDGLNAHQLAAKIAEADPSPPDDKKNLQPTIWRILTKPDFTPSLPTLRVLGSYFGVTTSQLLGETPLDEERMDPRIAHVVKVMKSLPPHAVDACVREIDSIAELVEQILGTQTDPVPYGGEERRHQYVNLPPEIERRDLRPLGSGAKFSINGSPLRPDTRPAKKVRSQ